LLGFTGFAFYYFRRTEHGYRHAAIWVILSSIVLSIIGGGLLYSTSLPERLERVFQENVSFYRKLQERKQRVWISPEQGLLAGTITRIISEKNIEIKDLQNNIWVIDISDTVWRGRLEPAEGLKIKIVGKMKEKNQFVANGIRPWKGRRYQHGNRHLSHKNKR